MAESYSKLKLSIEEKKAQILELTKEGWSKSEIAELTDMSMSTIRRVMIKLDLIVPSSRPKPKRIIIETPRRGIMLPDNYGIPLMEQVKVILGSRMSEYYGGFKLDGKPCSTTVLVNEAGLKFGKDN